MIFRTAAIPAILCVLAAVGSVIIAACNKSGTRNHRTTPMSFSIPQGFPSPVYDFSQNPVTEEGFALGRKLFHDNIISSHADVTCGSCHQQQSAYTTFDHDLGHGTNNQHTRRNVPVIFNMAWHSEFEWDGRNKKLADQVLACITAPERMGESINSVSQKLSGINEYNQMFSNAFGDEAVTGPRIASALSQFVVMLVSSNSKYDRVKAGIASFNASEQNGYELYKANCATCHTEPLFTDLSYRNNGIGLSSFRIDYGRMEVTGERADSLKFKVPTLRNVQMTGYFAHDGRYIAVTQMLNHYSSGIATQPTLDPLLQNGIPLTNLEKFYIEEFLFTLNDSTLIADPRFE